MRFERFFARGAEGAALVELEEERRRQGSRFASSAEKTHSNRNVCTSVFRLSA